MPLIKCPDCGKEVSSYAKVCPNCGYPIAELGGEPLQAVHQEKVEEKPVKKPLIKRCSQCTHYGDLKKWSSFLNTYRKAGKGCTLSGKEEYECIPLFCADYNWNGKK